MTIASGSEAALRRALARTIVRADAYAHVVQVENGLAGPGTPDTYARIFGEAMWIECKHAHRPARQTTRMRLEHLTTDQIGWHAREIRAGGTVWIVLQSGARYWVLHPENGPRLRGRGMTAKELDRESAFPHGHATRMSNALVEALLNKPDEEGLTQ